MMKRKSREMQPLAPGDADGGGRVTAEEVSP